jgi:hypothetical protein
MTKEGVGGEQLQDARSAPASQGATTAALTGKAATPLT